MNQLDALALFVDSLEAAQPHPVSTKHSDERQTPGVVIEDWDATPRSYANSLYSGPATDDFGNITGRTYTKHWHAVIDLTISSTDEVEVHEILNSLSSYFLPYEVTPRSLHADIQSLTVGPMRPRSLQFSPPVPTHSAVAIIEVEFKNTTEQTLAESGEDVLQQITNNYITS